MIAALAWRNLWRRPWRTGLSIAGLAFSGAFLVFMPSMQNGAYRSMIENTLRLFDGYAQLERPGYRESPEIRDTITDVDTLLADLRAIDGLDAVSARASAYVLLSAGERSFGAQVVGVQPATEREVSRVPDNVVAGRFLAPGAPGEIVLGATLASNLKLGIGDAVTLLGTGHDGSLAADSLTVVGTFETGIGEMDRLMAEIPLGHGVIGVAARERTPIRIGYMTAEYAYSRAIRTSALQDGMADKLETEIPLPGLPASRSQLAVPIVAFERLLGVLYVESPQDMRFSYDDEDALVAVAGQLGSTIHVLQNTADEAEDPAAKPVRPAAVSGQPVVITHYAENDSVFLDKDYLIKGVAGAIFWALVRDYVNEQRTAFSNRELRLDRRIRLPDISDNLEARLILLERRLSEHKACVRIEKTGRGRFRLDVNRPLQLKDVSTGLPK